MRRFAPELPSTERRAVAQPEGPAAEGHVDCPALSTSQVSYRRHNDVAEVTRCRVWLTHASMVGSGASLKN